MGTDCSIVWAGVSQRLMLQREDQLRAEFSQQRSADKAEFAAQLAQQATLCSPDKVGHTAFSLCPFSFPHTQAGWG